MHGHDIVVIGASAGGIEALRELVSKLPPDLEAALDRAQKGPGSALIEIRVDPEAISPRATLSGIRSDALKARE